MEQYRFTKKHTQIAKGIAMILMLSEHLYWMGYGQYTTLIKLPNGYDIPWMIGSIGRICVSMFLLLSGYGMHYTQKKKDKFTIKDSLISDKKHLDSIFIDNDCNYSNRYLVWKNRYKF